MDELDLKDEDEDNFEIIDYNQLRNGGVLTADKGKTLHDVNLLNNQDIIFNDKKRPWVRANCLRCRFAESPYRRLAASDIRTHLHAFHLQGGEGWLRARGRG